MGGGDVLYARRYLIGIYCQLWSHETRDNGNMYMLQNSEPIY